MTEKPGRIGKQYPATEGNHASSNHAPTAQAHASAGDRVGLIALILGIIAVILAVALYLSVRTVASDVENIRGLIENSAASASQSASAAAVAADRTDRAERRANIAEAYAKQVYVELNRLGYPVQTPIEEHSVAPVEAYKHDP